MLHHHGEAEQFYAGLVGEVRVGHRGHPAVWFERFLYRMGRELSIAAAARIRPAAVRKQKSDRRGAELILRLLVEDRFPRIWTPSQLDRDQRQLLVHRLVQLRTHVKNQLQALALDEGPQRGRKLWSQASRQQLRRLDLLPYTARRRDELLELLDKLDDHIAPLECSRC